MVALAVGLVGLAWAAVAAYAVHRSLSIAEAWAERDHDVRLARVTADMKIAEIQHPPGKPQTKPSRNDIQLPDDLDAWANSWNDEWAREDTKTDLRNKFLELHSGDTDGTWQRVRRAIGIGELP